MTEQSKFTKIDTIPLYNDGIGEVSLWDASHSNESEAQRVHTVTQVASLAYGSESAKNPEALYKRLQELHHESLWEFIRSGDSFDGSTIEDSMRNQYFDYSNNDEAMGYFASPLHKQNIACFKIKVPLFIRSQFMRHRSFSYLEMSRRYTKGSKQPFEFWFPTEIIEDYKQDFITEWTEGCKYLVDMGLHTQVASRFLPQTTYTEFFCMAEVEGLKNFFALRLDSHAQEEIRTLSFAMLDLLKQHQPELYEKVKP